MALCESSNRKMRWQKQSKIFFFSANTSGAGGTNSKTLKTTHGHSKESEDPDTNFFKSLILKHDRA